MQWNDELNAGFSNGQPWLKVNPNFAQLNVEQAINDPNSIYHYYKKLINLRKANLVLIYGSYELILEKHEQIYAYTRTLNNEKILIMTNLFSQEAEFTLPMDVTYASKELLISNYKVHRDEDIQNVKLKPYEARVYRLV